MSELNKDKIIEKLTELGAVFSKRESKDKLLEKLNDLAPKDEVALEPLQGEFISASDDSKKYLKNGRTGFVFEATPALLRADDLLPATEAEFKAFKGIK